MRRKAGEVWREIRAAQHLEKIRGALEGISQSTRGIRSWSLAGTWQKFWWKSGPQKIWRATRRGGQVSHLLVVHQRVPHDRASEAAVDVSGGWLSKGIPGGRLWPSSGLPAPSPVPGPFLGPSWSLSWGLLGASWHLSHCLHQGLPVAFLGAFWRLSRAFPGPPVAFWSITGILWGALSRASAVVLRAASCGSHRSRDRRNALSMWPVLNARRKPQRPAENLRESLQA